MDPPAEDDLPVARSWPPQLRVAAAVGWSSFLAACLGTMLTFAALDPQVIIDGVAGAGPVEGHWWFTRTGLYSVGFFLYWAVAAVAGVLTAYLQQSPPVSGHGP